MQSELKVYILPLAVDGVERAIQLRGKEGKYVGGIPVSGKGLYNIVVVYDNRQLMSTVHVVPDEDTPCEAVRLHGSEPCLFFVIITHSYAENNIFSESIPELFQKCPLYK